MFWNWHKDEHIGETVARRRRLNPELQKLIDQEEEFLDQIYDGSSADTTETTYRYAGYATRVRTILLSAHRYVAYTSDIGESFRPVAHPWIVRGAYGVSWAYILGDVANEGYKAYVRNRRLVAPEGDDYKSAVTVDVDTHAIAKEGLKQHQEQAAQPGQDRHPMPWPDPEADTLTPWPTKRIPLSEDYRSIMGERFVFQAIASMGLPAFTIHSIVKYSGRALKGVRNTTLRTYGPIGLGLSIVPFLPYLYDKPVEEAVEWGFRKAFLAIGGPDAIPHGALRDIEEAKKIAEAEREEERRQHRRERREKRRAERDQLLEKQKEE